MIVLVLAILLAISPLVAADLGKAKGTVDAVRATDPPQVSTTTKPSPVGQPITDYKPKGPSFKDHGTPPPQRPYNPQNDPDVQRGWNKHQKQHGR